MNIDQTQIVKPCWQEEPRPRQRRYQVLDAMEPGKVYRPHEIGELLQGLGMEIKEQGIWRYLRQLTDEGHVERILSDGKIYFGVERKS